MSSADDIRDELNKLGPTAADIAQTLADKGITGIRFSDRVNPLINHLHSRGFKNLVLSRGRILQRRYSDGWDTDMGPLPAACADFADAFDEGRYPQLIDERVAR